MFKYHCPNPKCKRLKSCIRYGKFKLKDGKQVQRIRCLSCGKTSILSYQHPFLDKMHTGLKEFHKAIELYSNGYTIKDISEQLKKRPNTVIDWVRKVKGDIKSYRACLIFSGDYGEDEINSVLYSFKERTIKRRYLPKHKIDTMPLPTYKRGGKVMFRYY